MVWNSFSVIDTLRIPFESKEIPVEWCPSDIVLIRRSRQRSWILKFITLFWSGPNDCVHCRVTLQSAIDSFFGWPSKAPNRRYRHFHQKIGSNELETVLMIARHSKSQKNGETHQNRLKRSLYDRFLAISSEFRSFWTQCHTLNLDLKTL